MFDFDKCFSLNTRIAPFPQSMRNNYNIKSPCIFSVFDVHVYDYI